MQTITGGQVLAAVKHRGYLEFDADTTVKLTQFLNSEHLNWLYCSMLDVRFWPKMGHVTSSINQIMAFLEATITWETPACSFMGDIKEMYLMP